MRKPLVPELILSIRFFPTEGNPTDEVCLRLPEEMEKRLEALAMKTERSKQLHAREILEEHLGEYEMRLGYAEEAERILELYNKVPL